MKNPNKNEITSLGIRFLYTCFMSLIIGFGAYVCSQSIIVWLIPKRFLNPDRRLVLDDNDPKRSVAALPRLVPPHERPAKAVELAKLPHKTETRPRHVRFEKDVERLAKQVADLGLVSTSLRPYDKEEYAAPAGHRPSFAFASRLSSCASSSAFGVLRKYR